MSRQRYRQLCLALIGVLMAAGVWYRPEMVEFTLYTVSKGVDRACQLFLMPWYRVTYTLQTWVTHWYDMYTSYTLYHQRYVTLYQEHLALYGAYAAAQEQVHRQRAWWHMTADGASALTLDHARVITLARLMVRHDQGARRWIMIDRGAAHGVVEDAILVIEGVLVGRLSHVYDVCSRVMLVTDPQSGVPVCDAPRTYSGILEGDPDDPTGMVIRYVPHTAKPMVGDVVVCSGQGTLFPAGMAVARITSVSRHNTDVTYMVRAQPLVNPAVPLVAAVVQPCKEVA